MTQVDLTKIHIKRQKRWSDKNIYSVSEDLSKPKFYVLDMFPYPSGAGLHVWHPKWYIATDVIARKKMLEWYNVLHPMWFDTFGLWTENYAIKHKVKPQYAAQKNIARYIEQLKMFGCTYDRKRSFSTADVDYYKRTQTIFLKLYEHYYDQQQQIAKPISDLLSKIDSGTIKIAEWLSKSDFINSKRLAYVDFKPINRCPNCQTSLANEDLEDWKCERCSSDVEQKPMKQRVLRITDYAERLLEGLDKLDQRTYSDKEMQRNRIWKSQWTEFSFETETWEKIFVYTTRIDTVFGATFLVLAPEHNLVDIITTSSQKEIVVKYQEEAKKKTQLERIELQKDKTGVFTWAYAINPFNNDKIPIWIADYVMMWYWTWAIMAVPAHDERDNEFAHKYQLEIKEVIVSDLEPNYDKVFCWKWKLINSGAFTWMSSEDATKVMQSFLKDKKIWWPKNQYKLQDWVFSRQRYWWEPIPMVWIREDSTQDYTKLECLEESDLPLELPDVENYEPTWTEEWPLANIEKRVYWKLPDWRKFRRETNTMPGRAGSSWYRIRYMDPKNSKQIVSKENQNYRKNVDVYVWWAEHVTRHMIYARFWQKFLFDIGVVSEDEPFLKYQKVGLIMAEDWRKMSKRRWNVVNPDDVINEYWNDTLRVYEMFIWPFDQAVARNTNWLKWVKKFLNKVEKLSSMITLENELEIPILHKTIKKVTEDIDNFSYNTAISQLMICVNHLIENWWTNKNSFEKVLLLLSPFAPHLAEELWEKVWNKNMIFELDSKRPTYNKTMIVEDIIFLPVQFSGKTRWNIEVDKNINQNELLEKIKSDSKLSKYITSEPKKIIYVPGRILNIVL